MSKKPLLYLYKEGNWFILDKDQCGKRMHTYPHNSLIWHQCPAATDEYKGCWRLGGVSLNMPCGVCQEVCPDGLQALWRFHNWDTMNDFHFGKWDGSFYLHGTTKAV